ncbi:MAG: hypothetical protein QM715_00070 [Nibricoccus sp.]
MNRVFVLFLLILASCTTPKITHFDDSRSQIPDREPAEARVIAQGQKLIVESSNQRSFWLVGATVEIIDGAVYLDPINISSVAPSVITIDLSKYLLPNNWKNHLYWVQNIQASPIFPKERTIYRKKIVVE